MPKAKQQAVLRLPYLTHYYSREGGEHIPRLIHSGACKAEDTAVRQAFWRVFRGDYTRAEVIERKSGLCLWTVSLVSGRRAPEVRMGHRPTNVVPLKRHA